MLQGLSKQQNTVKALAPADTIAIYTPPNAARFPSLAIASFEIIQIRKDFKPWPW
jgi:hypothetical protein